MFKEHLQIIKNGESFPISLRSSKSLGAAAIIAKLPDQSPEAFYSNFRNSSTLLAYLNILNKNTSL